MVPKYILPPAYCHYCLFVVYEEMAELLLHFKCMLDERDEGMHVCIDLEINLKFLQVFLLFRLWSETYDLRRKGKPKRQK